MRPKHLARAAVLAATLTLSTCTVPTFAASYVVYTDHADVSRVTSVYDGDTIRVDIDGWPTIIGGDIPIRLAGIDTPELRGADCADEKLLGYTARNRLTDLLLGAEHIELRNLGRDPFFRVLAQVWVDGQSASQILRQEGLAHEYHGGEKQSWCNGEGVVLPTMIVTPEGIAE